MAKTEETTIDVPSRSGLRGRIDRLAHEYMLKASALKIASEILDEDDRKTALATAPKKFLQAINHRNGDEPQPRKPTRQQGGRKTRDERISEVADYLRDNPGALTADIAEALGWRLNQVLKYAIQVATRTKSGRGVASQWTLKTSGGSSPTRKKTTRGKPFKHSSASWYSKPTIQGKALTLFLLEHLMDNTEQSAQKMVDELKAAGSPVKSVRYLNAPLGAGLVSNGLAKKVKDGYRRTVKGALRMVELRSMLEATGKIKVGGYTAV